MMSRVGSREVKYGIAHGGLIISTILPNGTPSFSSTPVLFDTYESALSYLEGSIQNILRNPITNDHYPKHDPAMLNKFSIVEKVVEVKKSSGELNLYKLFMSNFNTQIEPISPFDETILRAMFIDAIRHGFHVIGIGSGKYALELIENPKYSKLFEDIVPMHVIENIEEFIFQGILTCSDDHKGAIILTTTEETLKEIGFKFK